MIKNALEDNLNLSLRIRTMQTTGNLMYAAGNVDYNVLEVKTYFVILIKYVSIVNKNFKLLTYCRL